MLAVARSARHRRWITSTLTPEFAVCELEPGSLADPTPWLDAAAAVVTLGPEDGPESVEPLQGLAAIPARSSLVLLLDGAPEQSVETALDRLEPAQVVGGPVMGRALRYAVRRAIPSDEPGRGARPHQRPTPALLGVSSAIREVIDHVRQIAPTPIPALILGETGTGKELVARAIHEQSPRAEHSFVAVNCGAIPDSLLESELFGHRRGCLHRRRPEQAGPLRARPRRHHLPRRDRRHLASAPDEAASCARDQGDPRAGRHRDDSRRRARRLRHPPGSGERHRGGRLPTGSLLSPERAHHLRAPPAPAPRGHPFLAQHFAEEFGVSHARRITLAEDFIQSLSERDFPGNVRELRNAVERAIALAVPGEPVTSEHLQPTPGSATRGSATPRARSGSSSTGRGQRDPGGAGPPRRQPARRGGSARALAARAALQAAPARARLGRLPGPLPVGLVEQRDRMRDPRAKIVGGDAGAELHQAAWVSTGDHVR